MKFRYLTPFDIPKLESILSKCHDFPLPDYNDFIITGVIEDDEGEIIAAGILCKIYEVILVLDIERRKRDCFNAIVELLKEGIKSSLTLGIPGWHAFVKEAEFIDVLQKNFGFTRCKGEALYLDLIGDSNGKKRD